jgi:hypothetical protein
MSKEVSEKVSKEISPTGEELAEYLEDVFVKLDNELNAIEKFEKSREELIEKENEYYKNLVGAVEEVAMSKYLTKEEFLKKRPVRFEDVEIPEWDAKVRVKELMSSARDKWEQSNLQDAGKGQMKLRLQNARARLVAASVIDPDSGELVFTDEDVLAIGGQSAAVIDRIYDVAARLSGITENDLEEITKN